MELSVVELFAGVGGFRVGLNHIESFDKDSGLAKENGKWDFVWANQFEPSVKTQHAFECYTTRFGHEDVSNEDIFKVDKQSIPEHSLLVGGFPCQDYSVARTLSNEQGIKGKKGVLFWEIRDVIEAKRPPFVLLENVDRLLKSPSAQRGRDFAVMMKAFQDLGYLLMWRVINAAEYGFAQRRRRVFVFAVNKNTSYAQRLIKGRYHEDLINEIPFNLIFPVQLNYNEKNIVDINEYEDIFSISNDYSNGGFLNTGIMVDGIVYQSQFEVGREFTNTLGHVVNEARGLSNEDLSSFVLSEDNLKKFKYLKGAKKINRKAKNGHEYVYSEGGMSFPDSLDMPARTMLTSESTTNRSTHIILDEEIGELRKLTPMECELLQNFPADWTCTMPNRNRYFMMGNALVTGIISSLEPLLKEIIQSE